MMNLSLRARGGGLQPIFVSNVWHLRVRGGLSLPPVSTPVVGEGGQLYSRPEILKFVLELPCIYLIVSFIVRLLEVV